MTSQTRKRACTPDRARAHTRLHTHARARACTHVHTRARTRIRACTRTHTHTHARACAHRHTHAPILPSANSSPCRRADLGAAEASALLGKLMALQVRTALASRRMRHGNPGGMEFRMALWHGVRLRREGRIRPGSRAARCSLRSLANLEAHVSSQKRCVWLQRRDDRIWWGRLCLQTGGAMLIAWTIYTNRRP